MKIEFDHSKRSFFGSMLNIDLAEELENLADKNITPKDYPSLSDRKLTAIAVSMLSTALVVYPYKVLITDEELSSKLKQYIEYWIEEGLDNEGKLSQYIEELQNEGILDEIVLRLKNENLFIHPADYYGYSKSLDIDHSKENFFEAVGIKDGEKLKTKILKQLSNDEKPDPVEYSVFIFKILNIATENPMMTAMFKIALLLNNLKDEHVEEAEFLKEFFSRGWSTASAESLLLSGRSTKSELYELYYYSGLLEKARKVLEKDFINIAGETDF